MYQGKMYDLYKRDQHGAPVAAQFRVLPGSDGWFQIQISADDPDAKTQIAVQCSLISGRFVMDVVDAAALEVTEEIWGAVATGTVSIPLRSPRKEECQ